MLLLISLCCHAVSLLWRSTPEVCAKCKCCSWASHCSCCRHATSRSHSFLYLCQCLFSTNSGPNLFSRCFRCETHDSPTFISSDKEIFGPACICYKKNFATYLFFASTLIGQQPARHCTCIHDTRVFTR